MKRKLLRITYICFVPALLILFGCSEEFKRSFKELKYLRQDVINEFNEKNVRVMIQNGNCIGVSLINSKYFNQSDEIQEEVRRKIIKMIDERYTDHSNIDSVWIAFVRLKVYFFLFRTTNALNTNFYKKSVSGEWEKTLDGNLHNKELLERLKRK